MELKEAMIRITEAARGYHNPRIALPWMALRELERLLADAFGLRPALHYGGELMLNGVKFIDLEHPLAPEPPRTWWGLGE